MGQEGVGKSTLLQLMDGLLRPQRGTLFIDGKDVWQSTGHLRELRRQVGFAFQFPEDQFFCETVEEELGFGPRNLGLDIGSLSTVGETILEEMGMPPGEFLHRSPFSLSMGEARRVALACVLVARPQALLIDEPTAGLDGKGAEFVLMTLRKLRADGVTIIIVSHDVNLLSELVSRVVMLNNKTVGLDEPAAHVFSDAQKLGAYGYELPDVMQFVKSLKERGHPIADGFYTLEQIRRAIAPVKKE
jgi:energy-coupling factor transport system ATP-binding protein